MPIDITHALDKIGGTLLDYDGYEPAAPGNYASVVVLVKRTGHYFVRGTISATRLMRENT